MDTPQIGSYNNPLSCNLQGLDFQELPNNENLILIIKEVLIGSGGQNILDMWSL